MFKLPEEVKNGIKNYRDSLKEVIEGKISSARFKGIRVPWGIYSHRGGKVYMTRIRIPAGVVSALQLKALAHVSLKYGDGNLHITTREDIQIHNVKIENTIKIIDCLKDDDLSPRGGGGNTVRNIIACHLSGVCKEEIFDVRKYALALSEYLLSQDSSFKLPRKFKISFSGCLKDCTGCLVNDLGFFASFKDNKRGFKAYVGGGLGASSRIGKLLEEFISEEDLGYCVLAVKNIFYKKGDRKNKHHNRLRFLIENIGFEEFYELYKKEFQDLKEKEYISLRKIDIPGREKIDSQIPKVEDKNYNEFLKYSIYPQKQVGFVSVKLRIPRGDIRAEKLIALADLEKDFSGIEFRASENQNLSICWVEKSELHELFLKLQEILGDCLYSETLLDVVVCKGALTCNLGLCNSPALAEQLENVIKEEFIGKKIFKEWEIRFNGCPNACGQHPIGKLSFHGMVKRIDNRPAPFYKILLGGRKGAESTRLAEEVGIIPARNVPDFLRDFLRKLEQETESKDTAKKVLEDYSYMPSYSEDRSFYIDWGRTEEFSLAGLGTGECGAGILDIIEADLADAKVALEEAEKENFPPEYIKKVLFLSARALLVVKGKEAKDEYGVFLDFKEEFIDKTIADPSYLDIRAVYRDLKEGLSVEDRKEKFIYAKRFLEHINELYKSMDQTFNFPEKAVSSQKEAQVNILDLLGTPCPINYVKVKLALEDFQSGDMLNVLLDEGEPIENVPKSLEGDGHHVIKIEKIDGYYKVTVKKK